MDKALTACLLASALCGPQAAAVASEPAAGSQVVPLVNGMNRISLTATSAPAIAMLAHRENFNAHGFEVLTLYIQAPALADQPPQWQIVPVLDKQGERLTLASSGGADCVLHDFRLLSASTTGDATLVLADRDPGRSFSSPAPVSLRFFKLRTNSRGEPGWPLYYFEFDHAQRAAKTYCDVGDALQMELGMASYRPPRP